MPLDIRVERETADLRPEHRSSQRQYLEKQVSDLDSTFDPRLASVAPERVYNASAAMSSVLVEAAAALAGIQPGPVYERLDQSIRSTSRVLQESLRKETRPGP